MRLCQLGGGRRQGYRPSIALNTSCGISRFSSPFAYVFLIPNGVKLALRDKLGLCERVTPASPSFFFNFAFPRVIPNISFLSLSLVIYPGQQLGSHRSERRTIVPSPRPKYHDEFRFALRLRNLI
ncbi:hypothetical protein PDIG_55280 [Penicillium digitatum PHI26]|uniref:Uncharacterized protein n=2 Tax=Penicillium digitatum TaxID=36651 RepID=K9FM42_PEND2|nr:hypothetical protein PDIP_14670 [Penicillium digitatum Pd1]EKV10690.1 hypothetical protein PDIG_55280 [Penicillium digitatum PHI26]EKV20640.1 hypothetical protein PDIP_14670 [Penicillium digitatum Pd1]